MARTRTSPTTDVYLVPATMRQPASELGPRARRTIARILDAAREVFLANGYGGTTIDEIANVAEVSRASVYTYFPSKRDVLLAAGAQAATANEQMIERLRELGGTSEGVQAWVGEFFTHLDAHGSFAFAWTQAAHEDDEVRLAGMRRHLKLCTKLADVAAEHHGSAFDDPAAFGLAITSMLERAWNYSSLYGSKMERERLERTTGELIWSMLTRG